jgi:carbonic anhydrase
MPLIHDILRHNADFVARREFESYQTDRFPSMKLVVVTCMDTRLTELLPRAMGVRNGDIKLVKMAGAVISHPFGGAMRSVLVAVYELGASEVAVIGHLDCGMTGLSAERELAKTRDRGVSNQVIQMLTSAGVDLNRFLTGFESPKAGVLGTVELIRNHPLMPADVPVHGLLIDPQTGALEQIVNGYESRPSPAESSES